MFPSAIQTAEVEVPCTNLAVSLDFFTTRAGFRADLIFPADAPTTAVISAYGVRLRLITAQPSLPLRLTLHVDAAQWPNFAPHQLTGPDDVVIALVDAEPKVTIPIGAQEWIISRNNDANAWGTGRAGMQYRDLIPGRLGGRFVASHIRIPDGGKVPDYVHFHRVRFQMIYCKAGWVRVVYEDQGEPFVMHAGDCVLQPPQIRHRVLEASAGLEVIEVGCPAIHDTVADHALALPNAHVNTAREFGGQRFTRHIAANAAWSRHVKNDFARNDFDTCDLGLAAATTGLARVQVLRATRDIDVKRDAHRGELLFYFVLSGSLTLTKMSSTEHRREHRLNVNDSFVVPAGAAYALAAQAGTRLLEVAI
jgi:quercetin dioxygenase-like cupin family protein